MDQLAVPVSWLRQPENQGTLALDPLYVREGETITDAAQRESKQHPAVALYLLQFYPVSQACVQTCVTVTSSQMTTTVVPQQLSLQQPLSNGSYLISQSSQTSSLNCNECENSIDGKQVPVKLEAICFQPEQQAIGLSMEEEACSLKLERIDVQAEPQVVRQSHQCIVSQNSPVPMSKISSLQKWGDEGENTGHHVLSARSQEEGIHAHQTNQSTQVTNGEFLASSATSSYPIRAVRRAYSADQGQRPQPSDKPFSCSMCGKVFAREHNLKAHSQSHSRELPFPCKICRKSYSQEAYYRIHSEILSGGKPYTCEVCSKVFCNLRSFNFHVRSHSRKKLNT